MMDWNGMMDWTGLEWNDGLEWWNVTTYRVKITTASPLPVSPNCYGPHTKSVNAQNSLS